MKTIATTTFPDSQRFISLTCLWIQHVGVHHSFISSNFLTLDLTQHAARHKKQGNPNSFNKSFLDPIRAVILFESNLLSLAQPAGSAQVQAVLTLGMRNLRCVVTSLSYLERAGAAVCSRGKDSWLLIQIQKVNGFDQCKRFVKTV